MAFNPYWHHDWSSVIHVKLGPAPLFREKRLPDLDALFRDATRGKKIDVDIEFSGPLLDLWAQVDVRQGSCWLYSSEGYIRFEPAGAVFARIDSSCPERKYVYHDNARFSIRLTDDTYSTDNAYASIKMYVSREDGSEDRLDGRYCEQPLAIRKQVSSHVVRLRFMLSEDFRGKIYDCGIGVPK